VAPKKGFTIVPAGLAKLDGQRKKNNIVLSALNKSPQPTS
jgi:hypothetical protein